ncbi:helix-turn-helix transcriptional regulator [Siphonobacter sp. SORGH_AS_0500]|uniref:AraC family transcriptional regulator n=1 Tax=Siphonobacter sp. SORGH_AS_0500 TaxID=1864824 RepID=UPI00286758DA|nr:helix-turn-helix transcriptional regulator [Siphonobacter sp. SORGH_AS_0500]MDR6198083.1 AraC family transcriptional activator of pobA [Siphonobacter sp. SORGH_AS_0500]
MIQRFDEYLQEHKNLRLLHRHDFYHLILFTKGAGSHAIDFESFMVQPFQIYFMIPGQVHSWDFTSEVDGYVVNFSSAFFQSFLLRPDYLETFSFFSGIAQESVINLPEAIHESLVSRFEQLLSQHNHTSLPRVDRLRTLLLDIFFSIESYTAAKSTLSVTNYNYIILKNYQKLIDKNFLTMRLPMEYAKLLFVTPNHLNALCKEHLGMQAGELIRNRILLEAKRLLINFGMNISEISYALNFSDNSYFTKFFKKYTKITPEEFRKRNS